MADELDPGLESGLETGLRAALHAEADALPVRVRGTDLERLATERRRGARARHLGLLAAAAAVAVALGSAAILAATRPDGDVAAPPSPGLEPAAITLPDFERLGGLAAPGAVEVWRDEGTLDRSRDPYVHGFLRGPFDYDYLVACVGGGMLDVQLVVDSATNGLGQAECDGGLHRFWYAGGENASREWDAAAATLRLVPTGPVAFRLLVVDVGAASTPEPTPEPALASFQELEADLARGTIGATLLARAEDTDPDPDAGTSEVTLLRIDAVDHLQFEVSCVGGSYELETWEDGVQVFGFSTECDATSSGVTDGIVGEGRNVVVILRTVGPVAYRIVVGGWPPEGVEGPRLTPAEAPLEPGELGLASVAIVPGTGWQERTVAVPEGTDRYVLTAPCVGSGRLEVEIDGVRRTFECGAVGVVPFGLDGDGALTVRARATGPGTFALRVGRIDWARIPGSTFEPPALNLHRVQPDEGTVPALAAEPGAWTWRRDDGTSAVGGEPPAWVTDLPPLVVDRGSAVNAALSGEAWRITGADVAVARASDADADGDPLPEAIEARIGDGSITIPQLEPGEWIIRVIVSAERPTESFTVPYFARLLVVGE